PVTRAVPPSARSTPAAATVTGPAAESTPALVTVTDPADREFGRVTVLPSIRKPFVTETAAAALLSVSVPPPRTDSESAVTSVPPTLSRLPVPVTSAAPLTVTLPATSRTPATRPLLFWTVSEPAETSFCRVTALPSTRNWFVTETAAVGSLTV